MIELVSAFCLANSNMAPPAEVVNAFVAAYNAHDISALKGLVTEDARFGHSESVTGEVAIANYEAIVFARYPDVRLEVKDRLAVGNLVAQTEVLSGFEQPELGLSVYRIKDGCIVEMSINQ